MIERGTSRCGLWIVHSADPGLFPDGDLRGAAEHCRAALRLDTPDPLLRYRAAVILRAAGDTERAHTLQRQALAVQPRLAGYEQRGLARSVARSAAEQDARRD